MVGLGVGLVLGWIVELAIGWKQTAGYLKTEVHREMLRDFPSLPQLQCPLELKQMPTVRVCTFESTRTVFGQHT